MMYDLDTSMSESMCMVRNNSSMLSLVTTAPTPLVVTNVVNKEEAEEGSEQKEEEHVAYGMMYVIE